MNGRDETPRRVAIAGASAAVSMHPQTLRKYERAGLLRPARRSGGSRHYSADDIARLELIKQMADVRRINVAGMSLALALHDEITALLDALDAVEPPRAHALAQERLHAMLDLIAGTAHASLRAG